MVDFTLTLSNTSLTLGEFLARFEHYDSVAHNRFVQLKESEIAQVDFLLQNVSDIKNKISADKSAFILTVGRPIRLSRCSPVTTSEADGAVQCAAMTFSKSLKRFSKVSLPLHSVVEVQIVDYDSAPRRIRLDFVWKCEAFGEMHEQLCLAYRNNLQAADEIYVGMPCAVPLNSTKDYHRAVVKDVSKPLLPVVFYVDLGIEQGVAKACIRQLHTKFQEMPSFLLSGDVDESPTWPDRLLLGQKLKMLGRADVTAIKYNSKTDRYRLLLETDSGIASDASRDGLPSEVR